MTSPKPRRRSTARKAAELTLAVPQVVAHRVARMALAGPTPSARDRKEFIGMVAEKQAAFFSSWSAMATQAAIANQALALSWLRAFAPPGVGKRTTPAALAAQWQGAGLAVLDKGLDPVHRKAVANARRLARTKLR
ncbi:MAG: hypothetical protein KGL43_17700 [Burkholderiales bacterium]|nr:hypothetical protein [Burkholderiales bacterium]MDE2398095.1 hypothetical protein [Burkholderiales bacterium]MDE2455424.1 hypothetical protein [Burkholderiales bacterium]